MIELPMAPWHAALILMIIIFVAYKVGRHLGVKEGIEATIDTLKALNMITQKHIDQIIQSGEPEDNE